jgi:hypothetical protein
MTLKRSTWPPSKWALGDMYRFLEDVRQQIVAMGHTLPHLPPHLAEPVQAAEVLGLDLLKSDCPHLAPQISPVPPSLSPTPAPDSPYLTVVEAAYLRTTVQTVYDRVKRGTLHPVPGSRGRLLFTKEALDRFLLTRRRR